MSKHGSSYNEQVIEHLELLLNKEGQILTEDAEDYLRSVKAEFQMFVPEDDGSAMDWLENTIQKATEAERDRIASLCYQLDTDGEKMYRLIYKEV